MDSGISSRKLILLSDTFASGKFVLQIDRLISVSSSLLRFPSQIFLACANVEKDLPCEVLELIKEEDDGIVEVYQLQLGHEAMKTGMHKQWSCFIENSLCFNIR